MSEPSQGMILVVEDDAELRFVLKAHLHVAGFEIVEAENGRDALELAATELPDIIIMDIGLPVLDGIGVTRALKADKRTAHIPIIMLTARSGADDVVRGLEAGAQEYLPKPFELTELLARVRTVHRLAAARKDLNRLNTSLEAEVDIKTKRLRHLYEFMRDLNRADSRDQILDLLVNRIEQHLGARRVSLFLVDPTGLFLVCERGLGIDPAVVERVPVNEAGGITGQVFRSGKTLAARTYGATLRADRTYQRDAFCSTPLSSTSLETRDGVIGVLNVTEKSDAGPFAEDEIECIRSMTDATAIALVNVTRRTRLQHSVRVLLQTLGHLAEFRDEETTLHLERVSAMARLLAEEARHEGPYASQITSAFIEMLVQATPLHDIGKVGIPDVILTKPGKLTVEEFEIMKTHTEIGRRVLSRAIDPTCPVPLLQMCVDITYCHHERFDGNGYPRQIGGDDIPLSARMIAIVDAYDAITSERRYKTAKSHAEAVEIIRREAGEHFDPILAKAFLRCHERFDKVRKRFEENAPQAAGSLA